MTVNLRKPDIHKRSFGRSKREKKDLCILTVLLASGRGWRGRRGRRRLLWVRRGSQRRSRAGLGTQVRVKDLSLVLDRLFIFFCERRKRSTISVRLDFLKCVQILLLSKTLICSTKCLDLLYRFAFITRESRHVSVQICILEERQIWTHLRKSRRTETVGGFQLG